MRTFVVVRTFGLCAPALIRACAVSRRRARADCVTVAGAGASVAGAAACACAACAALALFAARVALAASDYTQIVVG